MGRGVVRAEEGGNVVKGIADVGVAEVKGVMLDSEPGKVHALEDAKVGARTHEITMDVFAHDESASVQVRRMRGNEGVVRRSRSFWAYMHGRKHRRGRSRTLVR